MPATTEGTPAYRPGYVGGLDFDRPGGLLIKGAKNVLTGKDKYGNPVYVDGLHVAMYKADPGVYYALNGRRVTDAVAAAAGYDVDAMAKLRKRVRFLQESADRFDELNKVQTGRTVLVERGGVQVVDVGGGRHILEDVSDASTPFNLTPNRFLSYDDAMQELARFLDEEAPPPVGSVVGDGVGSATPRPPEFRKVGSK